MPGFCLLYFGQFFLKNYEQRADEREDGEELRKCGVDEGVCHHVMSLGNSCDTVGADLPLADGGNHTYQTAGGTDTEKERAVGGEVGHELQPHEETCKSVDTL